MPLKRTSIRDFSKGKITDRTDVPGALWWATDVVYWRGVPCKRGAKVSIDATNASPAVTSSFGHAEEPDLGGLLSVYDGASYKLLTRSPAGTNWSELGLRYATAFEPIEGYDNYQQFARVGDELVSTTGFNLGGAGVRWAGSTKAAYSTGTVSSTAASRTITGVGTLWSANAEAGMFFTFEDSSGTSLYQRTFRITKVTSNTVLVLDAAPDESVAGKAYHIGPVGRLSAPTGIFASAVGTSDIPQATGLNIAAHQSRCILGYTRERVTLGSSLDYKWFPHRIRWCSLASESSAKFVGLDYWQANAYLDVAPGVGIEIRGIHSLGGRLMVIKDDALCAVDGALSSSGADLGASVDVVATGVGAIGRYAHDVGPRGLVFADEYGAYLYNGGSIVDLTLGRIKREWSDQGWQNTMVVSCIGNRAVFQDANNCYVYDFASETWTEQNGFVYGRICDVLDTTGAPLYELGALKSGNETHDWAGDYDVDVVSSADPGSALYPAMTIATHDIAVGDEAASETGRVQGIYLRATVDTAGVAPDIDVSVLQSGNAGGGATVSVGSITVADAVEGAHRLRASGITLEGRFSIIVAQNGQLDKFMLHQIEVITSHGRRSGG